MTKAIQIQDADGNILNGWNFGEVQSDQLSAEKPIQIVNTGDVALTGVRAWLDQGSTDDGALRVSFGNVAVTGTSAETATDLGDLAVGAALAGMAQYTAPGVPVDTGTLRVLAD